MNDNIEIEELKDQLGEIDRIDVLAELFKSGSFDFIVKGKDEFGEDCTHYKQLEALKILRSNQFEEFLYGGAAGGAKSWTGAAWLMFMCICFPGTRYFIARNELKDIIDSVLVTFHKVSRMYGFTDFKFNAVKNWITFGNGSHINFIEVKYKPSDPYYEDLGSTEYTCGWIEEIGEIHERAAIVLSSRTGRHMNKEYGIKKIVFYTCNPKANWAKTNFYVKDLNGTLEPEKKYLPCLITENPFIEKDYVDSLRRMAQKDKSLYERLFKGNWDYEDNPNALCEYEMIEQVFDNDHVEDGTTYLTADIARFGSDKAIIVVWKGWVAVEKVSFDISKTTDIEYAIRLLRRKYQLPKNRCIADQDGVGGGVVDGTGILGFTNGARPIKEKGDMPNYKNLQVQCLYHLADKINEGGLYITFDTSNEHRKEIKEDLNQIQSKNSDVRKLDCKNKEDIKKDIGRSPDWRDVFLMRVYFDLKPIRKKGLITRPRSSI